jgi:CBS domain-containing protein
MSKARDFMHPGVECIRQDDTLLVAARKMRELHVGALPICGEDDRMLGIITDRDIVVHCVALGMDPSETVAQQLAQGTPVWVDADADEKEVLRLMAANGIRRLPVIENQRLAGMISEADVATHLGQNKVAEFASSVYAAPPNS